MSPKNCHAWWKRNILGENLMYRLKKTVIKELKLIKWIAFDDKFRPRKFESRFKNWVHKGITATCTIT